MVEDGSLYIYLFCNSLSWIGSYMVFFFMNKYWYRYNLLLSIFIMKDNLDYWRENIFHLQKILKKITPNLTALLTLNSWKNKSYQFLKNCNVKKIVYIEFSRITFNKVKNDYNQTTGRREKIFKNASLCILKIIHLKDTQ